MTTRRTNDGSSCELGTVRVARGRGILIAHPSPSVRLGLAMELIDEHPVFMTNGTRALLRQLAAVLDGVLRAPEALMLGEQELLELTESPLWDEIASLHLTVMLIAAAEPVTRDADGGVEEAPDADRVRDLLAA